MHVDPIPIYFTDIHLTRLAHFLTSHQDSLQTCSLDTSEESLLKAEKHTGP